MPLNLNQVTIPSLDLAISVPFYQKLGLKLIVSALPHYARFECPVRSATFSIHQVEQLPEGEGIWVYFEIENLDSFCAQLAADKVAFDHLPKDQSWHWREARLKDPDGNQLILYYAGANRLNPPWRVEEDEGL